MPESGYTSAVNSQARRAFEDVETKARLQQMVQAALLFQQQQAAQQRQQQAKAAIGNMLPELAQLGAPPGGPGPQAPPPGAPSVPMTPPQPQGPPPMGLGSTGPATMLAPPPGAGAPPGMPPGAPPGAPPGPPAGAPPGGPAMAPPAPPVGWRSLPKPPEAAPPGGPAAIGPPPTDAVMPKQMVSVGDMVKLLSSKGITGDKALAMVEEWKPYMDDQNKQELAKLKVENQAQAAALSAYAHVMQANAAAQRAATGEKRVTQNQPLVDAKVKKLGGGGTPGNPDIAQPKAFDPAADKALDIQAWNYLMGKGLPYRKGTGGGKDANQVVMKRVGEIANTLGMSSEEIVAMPAEWKANAQSLAFQTKKLDAIEGTLSSFHNNLDTWDNIAKGLAPKLGGERVAAFAKDLKKIDFIGVKSFDEVKQKLQSQFNDPSVAAYMVAAMAAAMDYARIMQGPQSIASLTEGSRKDAERLISAGFNDKARAGVLAALESDTEGQVKGVRDQLEKIQKRMGNPAHKGTAPKSEYVELRKTKDGKTLGRKADGTVEVVSE